MSDLNVREFADEFGMRLRTVQRAIADGRVPAYQPPGSRRWRIPGWFVERERARIAVARQPVEAAS